MRKLILFAVLGLGGLVSAQNNEKLKKDLENKKNQKFDQYDFYVQNQLMQARSLGKSQKEQDKLRQKLQEERNKLAFFIEGMPFFYKEHDTDQINSSNADVLQNGQLTGLEGTKFLGDGIHIGVFDGGRAYEKHPDFLIDENNPQTTRITNKETTSTSYSSHATGVTGMIGGKGHDLSKRDNNGNSIPLGNTKGIIPNATFENYSFNSSILAGETTKKTVEEKILASQLNLSNHSYGISYGWDLRVFRDGAGNLDTNTTGWYWIGSYNPQSGQEYSLDGYYGDGDQTLDDIVYNNPSMILVKAAGNSFGDGPSSLPAYGNGTPIKKFYRRGQNWVEFPTGLAFPEDNCQRGHDCIGSGSLAKNIILVGATEKIKKNNGRYVGASDVEKAGYSSAGPRDDGAIKPDIAGVGSDVLYASTSTTGSVSWGQGNGTSYSSPKVTGILGIWTQINKTLFNNELFHAASAKALLIHSAQEAGTKGPDAWFGWGFADAKKGAELLVEKSNKTIIFEDKELENSGKDEIVVETDGKQPLKVTISWIDPSAKDIPQTFDEAHNNRKSRLVNDLDLRIINIETKEVFEPWKLDINNPLAAAIKGDNTVDNVEQVLIETPRAGKYAILVSHKNNLLDNEGNTTKKQKYTILATGYNNIYDLSANNSSEINVYPTLVDNTGIVTLSYNNTIDNVSIYDMAGNLIRQELINSPYHQIDVNTLPKGVYLLHIKAGDQKVTKKILK